MTKDELRRTNYVHYYKIIHFHRDIFGFSRPCNIFELMHLIGSEKGSQNYQKVKLDDHYISYIPLHRFGSVRRGGMKLTPDMEESYPWHKLRKSIEENGIIVPLIVEIHNDIRKRIRAVEGKHRAASISLIKPYNPFYPVPCLATVVDPIYTMYMHKRKHPDPGSSQGFRKFESR